MAGTVLGTGDTAMSRQTKCLPSAQREDDRQMANKEKCYKEKIQPDKELRREKGIHYVG